MKDSSKIAHFFYSICLVFVLSRFVLVLSGCYIFFKSVKTFGKFLTWSLHFFHREITLLHFCILNATMKWISSKSLILISLLQFSPGTTSLGKFGVLFAIHYQVYLPERSATRLYPKCYDKMEYSKDWIFTKFIIILTS